MEPTASMALRAARKAGDLIVRASDDMDRVGYQAKAAADFVTEVDIAAEKEILYQLGKAYPEHQFLCEESGLSGNEDSDYTWVIDPLDGTSNFLRGIPHYAISIACLHRGKIEHAVVYDPVRREEFIASRGRGAQLNGHRIRVGSRHELIDSLIGTGVPFLGHCDEHLDWVYPVPRGHHQSLNGCSPGRCCLAGSGLCCCGSPRRVLGDGAEPVGHRRRRITGSRGRRTHH